jgi:imidazolonepropionase-like amidohydrolase
MDPAQEKGELPPHYSAAVAAPAAHAPHFAPPAWHRRGVRRSRGLRFIGLAVLLFIGYAQWRQIPGSSGTGEVTANGLSVKRLQEDLAICAKLQSKPVDPAGLGREKNGRYIDGHKPTLIKNATVWVGEPAEGTSPEDAWAGKGWSWIAADVYLEYGLVRRVEKDISVDSVSKDVLVYEANGRPLTTGIIDMHSHAGVDSLPSLWGNEDTNEMSSDITPYVRSIDGIQPGDHQIQVIKSGGVTTSLILPGSGNNMGGEAYVVKLAVGKPDGRNETSAADMLADPDRTWRYMKMACGENAKRVYGKIGEHGPTSRLGESWEFRHAFEQAAKLVREQDDWCQAAEALGLDNAKGYLPQELRWESLGALLRGQVHLNTHCYTIPDLEAFVDHTNEFKFKVRAFHHAHQTYLVPEILKRAYGGDPPASAIFATNMWYKAESYVGSEYAGKKLWDEGLTPIYVSDNPVLNAQHVIFEAAKGYRFGLPYHAAMHSVTTAPAERLGLSQRLGKVKPGFDADIVVWDSDPLSVGAAPVQVWIDGTAQFEDPIELKKPAPELIVPNADLSTIVEEPVVEESIIYTGISKSFLDEDLAATVDANTYNLVITNGSVTCIGTCEAAVQAATSSRAKTIALKNGYLVPSFVAFGSGLGFNAIDAEKDTDNGASPNVFSRGVDGLALDTKKLHAAHRYGVTRAISAPKSSGGATHYGTSVGFLTGAATTLEKGAVFADDVAVHYTLGLSAKGGEGTPSISSAVGKLRHKLLEAVASLDNTEGVGKEDPYSEAAYLRKVVSGKVPLVLTVHSADTISAILKVKRTVQAAVAQGQRRSPTLRFVIYGGAESHLVADELAAADVAVVLAPLLSYRTSWDQRRALTGAPLTNGTAIDALVGAGVKVAIGMEEDWLVHDLALLAGIAYANGGGKIGEREALGLVGRNVYEILGLEGGKVEDEKQHFVVYEGSPLEIGSRVKAVGGGVGSVTVFE